MKSAMKSGQQKSGDSARRHASFGRMRTNLARSGTGKLVLLASLVTLLVIINLVVVIELGSVLGDFSGPSSHAR
jgi:hypothetical protein